MPKVTVEQLKKMPALEFIKAVQQACNIPQMSAELQLRLTILHGAGDKGITTFEGQDMLSAQQYHDTIDYTKLAELLNANGGLK